jgi:hypothetical protein
MIEGVVVANVLVGEPADRLRRALWRAVEVTAPARAA